MTISGEQLFDCKSNIILNDKCMEYLDIKKNIYANKEFGICFEFVDKNGNIYLKDKNFIEIFIKYKIQRNIVHILSIPDRIGYKLRVTLIKYNYNSEIAELGIPKMAKLDLNLQRQFFSVFKNFRYVPSNTGA